MHLPRAPSPVVLNSQCVGRPRPQIAPTRVRVHCDRVPPFIFYSSPSIAEQYCCCAGWNVARGRYGTLPRTGTSGPRGGSAVRQRRSPLVGLAALPGRYSMFNPQCAVRRPPHSFETRAFLLQEGGFGPGSHPITRMPRACLHDGLPSCPSPALLRGRPRAPEWTLRLHDGRKGAVRAASGPFRSPR